MQGCKGARVNNVGYVCGMWDVGCGMGLYKCAYFWMGMKRIDRWGLYVRLGGKDEMR